MITEMDQEARIFAFASAILAASDETVTVHRAVDIAVMFINLIERMEQLEIERWSRGHGSH